MRFGIRLVAIAAAWFVHAGLALAQPAPAAPPAAAAHPTDGLFVRVPERPDLVYLDGPIIGGSAGALAELLAGAPEIRTLVLDSAGGSIGQAVQLALLVGAAGLDTYVPPDAVCFSACPLVFLAGAARRADGPLGIHAFDSANPDRMPTAATYANLATLLEGFGVRPGLVDLLAATPADTMHVVTEDERLRFGLERDTEAFAGRVPVPELDGAARAILSFVPTAAAATLAADFGTVEWRIADHGAGPAIEAVVRIPGRGFAAMLLVERSGAAGAISIATLAAGDVPTIVEAIGVVTSPRNLSNPTPFPAVGGPMIDGVPAFWLGWPAEAQEENLARLAAADSLFVNVRFADGRAAFLGFPKGAAGNAVVAAVLAAWRAAPSGSEAGPARFLDPAFLNLPPVLSRPVTIAGFAVWTAVGAGRASARATLGEGIGSVTLAFDRSPDGSLIIAATPDAPAAANIGGIRLAGIDVSSAGQVRTAAGSPRPVAIGLFVPASDLAALLADVRAADAINFRLLRSDGTTVAVLTLGASARSAAVLAVAFGAPLP